MIDSLTAAVTGHRPPKLGLDWGHSNERSRFVVDCYRHVFGASRYDMVFVGGALGVDTLAARAAYLEGVPFTVAVPCRDHSSRWPGPAQERYRRMLDLAAEVVLVTDAPYSPHLMQVRNEWMVDRAGVLLAAWDGSAGGTQNCIRYAERVGVRVVNVVKGELA